MQGSLCYKGVKEVGGLIDTKRKWALSPPFRLSLRWTSFASDRDVGLITAEKGRKLTDVDCSLI